MGTDLVNSVTVYVAPLRGKELKLAFGVVPETDCVVAGVKEVAGVTRKDEVGDSSGDSHNLRNWNASSGIKEKDSVISKGSKEEALAICESGYPGVGTSADNVQNILKGEINDKYILAGGDDSVVESFPYSHFLHAVPDLHRTQQLLESQSFRLALPGHYIFMNNSLPGFEQLDDDTLMGYLQHFLEIA